MSANPRKIRGQTWLEDHSKHTNVYVGNYVTTKWSGGLFYRVLEVGQKVFGDPARLKPAVKLEGYEGYPPDKDGWLPMFYICQISYGTKRPK